jgi:hypothetical protein
MNTYQNLLSTFAGTLVFASMSTGCSNTKPEPQTPPRKPLAEIVMAEVKHGDAKLYEFEIPVRNDKTIYTINGIVLGELKKGERMYGTEELVDAFNAFNPDYSGANIHMGDKYIFPDRNTNLKIGRMPVSEKDEVSLDYTLDRKAKFEELYTQNEQKRLEKDSKHWKTYKKR